MLCHGHGIYHRNNSVNGDNDFNVDGRRESGSHFWPNLPNALSLISMILVQCVLYYYSAIIN